MNNFKELWENVIEEFGGYDKCKEMLGIPNIDFIMNAQGLREHMLQYRRANNIFEKHDNVVRLDIESSHIYKVYEIYECESIGIVRHPTATEPHWTVLAPWHIRHATDAEIAAGHRL